MKILHSPKSAAVQARSGTQPLVLVPTMGALHEGHLALIRRAKQLAGTQGRVWISLFVNPTQFGPKEDFSKYPRPFKRDAALCRQLGVDTIFAPKAETIYAPDDSTIVEETRLSQVLCGESRPGHFCGVCTIVARLFLITNPAIAVFGEKDYQQLAIIRRMVRDLHFSIRIVGVPIVREADGLALSSRNVYLSPKERQQASILRTALLEGKKRLRTDSPENVRRLVLQKILSASSARIDYVQVVDAETLEPVQTKTKKRLIAVAVFFGKTRLIDNIVT